MKYKLVLTAFLLTGILANESYSAITFQNLRGLELGTFMSTNGSINDSGSFTVNNNADSSYTGNGSITIFTTSATPNRARIGIQANYTVIDGGDFPIRVDIPNPIFPDSKLTAPLSILVVNGTNTSCNLLDSSSSLTRYCCTASGLGGTRTATFFLGSTVTLDTGFTPSQTNNTSIIITAIGDTSNC